MNTNMNTNQHEVDTTVVAKNLPRSENLSVHIAEFFSKCGPVSKIDIEDEIRGREEVSKALITFKDRKAAEDAVLMIGQYFEGRCVEVSWAHPQLLDQGKLSPDRTHSEATIRMDKDVGNIITAGDSEYLQELGHDMRSLWRPEQEEMQPFKEPKTTTIITTTTTHFEEPIETKPETTKEKIKEKVQKLKDRITGKEEIITEPVVAPEERALGENREVHQDVVHKLMEKLHPTSTTTTETTYPTEEYPGHHQKVLQAAERDAAGNQQTASPRI